MEKLSSFSGGNHMGDDLGYCQLIFFFAILCIEDTVFLVLESHTSEAVIAADALITIGNIFGTSSTFCTEEDTICILSDSDRFIDVFCIDSPDIMVVAVFRIIEACRVFDIFAGTDLVGEDAILRI